MKLLKTFIIIIVLTLDSAFSYSQWYTNNLGDSLYNDGCNADVDCIRATYDDSLYIVGAMTFAGPLVINSVAKWDGNNWVNLGNGCTHDLVFCAEKYLGNLFIGGSIWEIDYNPNIKNLGIWDGTNWHGPSIGKPNGPVYDFKVFDNKLFIAGDFGHFGTTVFNKIAAYDGTNWLNVGSIGKAYALEVFNGELYAGSYGLYKYLGGTSWEIMPGSPNGYIYDLKTDTFNNFLYVGGGFTVVGDTIMSYFAAMWDGFQWNSFGTDLDCSVYRQAMAVYRGDLYAGGCMDTLLNGTPVNYIVRWDGTKWDSLGKGANNVVMTLEVFKDTLYVGGAFTYVNGNQHAYGIAKWFMPDTNCDYIKPLIHTILPNTNTIRDTFYMNTDDSVQVQFYNNNAYVNSWQWDFGDTGTDTIQKPLHIYYNPGIYNISVIVNYQNCWDTATTMITVKPCDSLQAFIHTSADTIFYTDINPIPNVIFYSNPNADSWDWDFGDGTTGTGSNNSHKYDTAGTYLVSVIVVYGNCADTAYKTITIINNTGIKDINVKELDFKLYPNPSDNSFTIEAYIAADDKGIIKIYGLKGQLLKKLVLKKGSNKTMVHTLGWRKGIYICNLIINGKIIKSEKMVLVK